MQEPTSGFATVSRKPDFRVVPYGHAQFFKHYGDAWGDKETLLGFYAENGTYTDAASMVTVQGHARLARFMKVYLGYSPLCTVTFTRLTLGEHGFAAEWIWAGTNDGPLRIHGRECPRDGSPFSVPGVSVCTVDEAGKILTHIDYWDSAALIRDWPKAG